MSISKSYIGGRQSIVSYSATAATPAPWFQTKSIEFDGVGDFLDLQIGETDFQTLIRDSHTVSFWAKTSWTSNKTMLGSANTAFTTTGGDIRINYTSFYGYKFYQVGGRLGGHSWGGSVFFAAASDTTSTDWHHYCLVLERGETASDVGTYRLYINGVSRANGNTKTRTIQESSTVVNSSGVPVSWYVGARNNNSLSADQNFDGKMDEIAIWDTALDVDAVTAIYNSKAATNLLVDDGDYDYSSNLKHHYRLEDDATDEKENSDGVLEGNPVFSTDVPS